MTDDHGKKIARVEAQLEAIDKTLSGMQATLTLLADQKTRIDLNEANVTRLHETARDLDTNFDLFMERLNAINLEAATFTATVRSDLRWAKWLAGIFATAGASLATLALQLLFG